MKRGAQEIRNLPLKEEVKDKWLFNNAAALFGIK
jgi:predicted TIM-barrel fold metal-dependent hydrolase